MRQIRTAAAAMIALTVSVCSGSAVARQAPTAEVMSLGLRGVYFVENQGQWSDASVEYGFKSRGLDIAFRESSFTMHLSREVSRNVPVEVAVDPTDGAWASRPYEYQVVERASRPYESATVPEASLKHERGFFSFDDSHPLPHGRGSSGKPVEYEHLTLTVTFPGSNPAAPRGAQPQEAKFNYYIGDDETRWASNVPSFGAIVYENIYDGVNLFICGNDDGVLKYEFHVAPGADYSQIRIAYDGIDSLCVEESGDLRIATSFGTLMDSAPLVWQEDAAFSPSLGFAGEGRGGGDFSRRKDLTSRAREEAELDVVPDAPLPDSRGSSEPIRDTIPARFDLVDEATYRFALDGPVDPARTLIIDPDVEWMTYLGGQDRDVGIGIAADSSHSTWITGYTWSSDFVGRGNSHHGGVFDAFLLRIDSQGMLQWMTYLGGTAIDYGYTVAPDSSGGAYVSGFTDSIDFAGRINSYFGGTNDALLARVSAAGTLLWMAYIGGSDEDWGLGIDVDPAGRVLLVGRTFSADLVARQNEYGGAGDAFVAKTTPTGTVLWTKYYGGSGLDWGRRIVLDSFGIAYFAGTTESTDFAGRRNEYYGGDYDAFVLSIASDGELRWMNYLGGTQFDWGRGIAMDSTGSTFISGYTNSADFAARNNAYQGGSWDAFVVKVSPTGVADWMRFVGGSGNDHAWDIAVNSIGNVVLTGETASTDFFGRNNTYRGGSLDAFVCQLTNSGTSQSMTYLGGIAIDAGAGVCTDHNGTVLVTGYTSSADFSGRLNDHSGDYDTFLAVLRAEGFARLAVDATCPSGGQIQIEWSGSTPNGRVALAFARCSGDLLVRSGFPCQGTQLGLCGNQVQVAWDGRSDSNGARVLNAFAGNGACGGYLQLLDLTTCATSNVARIE